MVQACDTMGSAGATDKRTGASCGTQGRTSFRPSALRRARIRRMRAVFSPLCIPLVNIRQRMRLIQECGDDPRVFAVFQAN